MQKPKEIEDVINEISAHPASRVKVAVSDIDGVLRGKYIDKTKALSAVEKGFGFCGVIFGWDCHDTLYDKNKISGWHNGFPDMQAKLDPHTLRSIPWEGDLPFMLGDFSEDPNASHMCCPRAALKRVVKKANDMGYDPKVGMEFEWFNFKETPESLVEKGWDNLTPLTPGMFGYSVTRQGHNREFFETLFEEMGKFGVPLEGLHTETGPGVLEAAIRYSDALEAADRAILYKTSTKEIAARFGIMPTFMARWNEELPGSSGHLHQSLWTKNGSAFHNSSAQHEMSDVMKSYLAGQIRALPEMLLFQAPTPNSFRRLVEGFWAPTSSTWGVDNRTAAHRIISAGPATRIEVRVTGADANPYLAMAASIAAGLDGVENKLSLEQEALSGSAYEKSNGKKFPKTYEDAVNKLEGSELARKILGSEFVDHYVNSRRWEGECLKNSDILKERERYFEVI